MLLPLYRLGALRLCCIYFCEGLLIGFNLRTKDVLHNITCQPVFLSTRRNATLWGLHFSFRTWLECVQGLRYNWSCPNDLQFQKTQDLPLEGPTGFELPGVRTTNSMYRDQITHCGRSLRPLISPEVISGSMGSNLSSKLAPTLCCNYQYCAAWRVFRIKW